MSVAPGVRRSARAREDGTTVILVEGTPGAAYDARGWELWSPLAPRYFAGEYALVADRLREIVAAHPQYPMLFFNLACAESLLGRTDQALGHVRHAIDMSEEFRQSAREDPDLGALREDPDFPAVDWSFDAEGRR